MRVRILGCSGGIGAGLRTTSILVDHDVLIDAGTGVGDLPREDLKQIRHVFLTHSHLDHTVGLPLFIDTVFEHCIANPVEIYARSETIQALKDHMFNWEMWPDFAALPDAGTAVLNYNPIRPGDRIEVEGRRMYAVEVKHSVPSLGYCVQSNGKVLAFSGDTTKNETLWPALNTYDKVDALIIEVSFPNAQQQLANQSGHYCPITVAEDLAKLDHEPTIWVTAMKPGEEDTIFAEVKNALNGREVHRLYSGQAIDV